MATKPLNPNLKLNARQEAFCRGLAEGKSQQQAYIDAGYDGDIRERTAEASASRLLSNAKVAARVKELQAKHAEKSGITVKSLTDDLIRLRRLAEQNKQMSAGVAAVGLIAKLHGLIVEKQELRHEVVNKPTLDHDAPEEMPLEDWAKKYSGNGVVRH